MLQNKNIVLNNSEGWIKIDQPEITKIITDAYSDTYKAQLLVTNYKPMTKDELAKNSKMKLSTAYKKCNELIRDGLLVPMGVVETTTKLNTNYERLIAQVNFEFADKKIIHIKINEKIIKRMNLGKKMDGGN